MEEEKIKVPITWNVDGPDKAEPGDLVTFEVCAKDNFGNPFEVKPINLQAILSINDKHRGLCEETGKRRKIGVGAYAFDFVPRILGVHSLRLQNGITQLFKDTPIRIDIQKEVTDVTLDYEFELEGKALTAARINEPVTLTIYVKEKGRLADIEMNKFSVKNFRKCPHSFAPNLSHRHRHLPNYLL